MALFLNYDMPAYVLTAIGDAGELTYSSAGNPPSYTAIIAAAALLRANVASVKFKNVAPILNRGGRMWNISWQALADSSGVFTLPATSAAITTHPLVTVNDWADRKIANNEYTISKEFTSQLDFSYPNTVNVQESAKCLIFHWSVPNATSGSSNMIQASLTLGYEWVPKMAQQVLSPTAATNVTESAVSEVSDAIASASGGDSNTGPAPAGLLEKVVGVAKDVYNVGKEVWDFASPFVSAVGGLLGFLEPHEQQALERSFCIYMQMVNKIHRARPDLVTIHEIEYLQNHFWGPLRQYNGNKLALTAEPHVLAIRDYIFSQLWPLWCPVTTKWLRERLSFSGPVYRVDSSMVQDFVLTPTRNDGSRDMMAANNYVASLKLIEGTIYELTAVSMLAYITTSDPPLLTFNLGGAEYSTPLINETSRSIKAEFADFKRARPESKGFDSVIESLICLSVQDESPVVEEADEKSDSPQIVEVPPQRQIRQSSSTGNRAGWFT